MRERPELSDAGIVLAVRGGSTEMFGELFDRWFDRVHDVARNIVRNPDSASDVAQDAFISAWQQLDKLDDPDAFGGWLLRITRNRALDRLQRDQRSRPQEDHVVTRQHDAGAADPIGTRRRDDPADITTDLERDGLVGAAAVALGVRDASLLDLHVRHGLGAAEIAKETGASANSVHQQLFRMRDRLGNAIGAMLLWQRGRPTCDKLSALLSDGGEFDAEVFGVVERHRRKCDDCTDRRTGMVAPEALFAALPIAVVPLTLRAGVAQGIRAAGVPLGPTEGAASDTTDGSEPGSSTDDAEVTPNGMSDGSSASVSGTAAVALPCSRRATARRLLMVAAVLLLVSVGVAGVALSGRSSEQVSGFLADTERSDGLDVVPGTVVGSEEPGSTEQEATASESTTSLTALGAPAPTTDAPAAQSQVSTTLPVAPNQPASSAAPRQQPPPPPLVVAQTTLPTATTPPPPTQPSATTSPPTTRLPPTSTAPPAVPIVTSFTAKAGPGGLLCISPSQSPRTFDWTSVNASSATLTIAGVSRSVPTNGTFDACGGAGDLAILEAQSPGGTAQRSLNLP